VALTEKTLSVVGCRPLAGGLTTPAAESVHARRSRTLVTVLGSAVAAPHGLAQPLVGCALAGRIPLLSWAACSLSGPRCTVVLGREAVSTHGAVVKT
jgi:hypothetical protein